MNKEIDISNIILTTERLTLRPWKESDLNDLYEYASVDGVGQMAGWLPHKTIDTSKEILNIFIEAKRTFALEYQGKVIGSLGMERYREKEYPELDGLLGRELGYVLSKDYWGRGIMPEAVKAVISYLFETEHLDFIIAAYFDWNRQSARVVQKCGFEYIKTLTYHTKVGTAVTSIQNILYKSP